MPDLTSRARAEALRLGADMFGVAPVDRFDGAPEGFHPRDVYADTRSVAVFARRLPSEVMFARSCVPYTHANELLLRQVDDIALRLSLWLEGEGVRAVLVPSDDPYEAWDAERQHGRGILSMRHAAELAGLGRIGRSNLLINDRFGNLLQLGAVLVAEALEPSAPAAYVVCPEGCSRCIDACPARALDGRTVRQRDCRPRSNARTEKGYVLKRCWECRRVCPSALGVGRA
jgi:epoxyqueuosine reductase